MAGTLGLIFRGRPRLLPLALAVLGATALTFGALSAVGASLTVASIAVLPVLVGLAVDYAIQFQSRVGEGDAADPAAVVRAAAAGGPTIADRRGGERRGDAGAAALPGADGARLRGAARRRGRDRAALRAARRGGAITVAPGLSRGRAAPARAPLERRVVARGGGAAAPTTR